MPVLNCCDSTACFKSPVYGNIPLPTSQTIIISVEKKYWVSIIILEIDGKLNY